MLHLNPNISRECYISLNAPVTFRTPVYVKNVKPLVVTQLYQYLVQLYGCYMLILPSSILPYTLKVG